jgi:hypothetical protein
MSDSNVEDALSAAREMGIEADAEDARKWMLAVAASEDRDQITADVHSGIFGDRVSLLDFDTDDLERFRRLVPYVRIEPHPQMESAISIAGSAAQGKVQVFPGDADFFERVHIHAKNEDEAKSILRDILRTTALRAAEQPDIVLLTVDMGAYPEPVIERGHHKKAGDSTDWTTEDVARGAITVEVEAGGTRTYAWDDMEVGTGWLFLGWIIAEREEGRIALASNVIDVTWEDPKGAISALDGAVDPLVQEIYLELSAIDLVARLAPHIPEGARSNYQNIMREQVYHYTKEAPSYGKAAKRLYNLFRVSDQLEAAAFVRELFDEPSARLYQVPGLLDAADVALDPTSGIDRETVMHQLDVVADAIAEVTEGDEEAELLAALQQLREAAVADGKAGESWAEVLGEVRTRCSEIVSEFFRVRLLGFAPVREFLDKLEKPA